MDLVTQDSYEKRHKPSTIPAALVKEKEVKQEPIEKIHKNYQPNKSAHTGRPTQKKNDCGFCGQQNWSPSHKCPAKTAERYNRHKLRYFARVCRVFIQLINSEFLEQKLNLLLTGLQLLYDNNNAAQQWKITLN